MDTGRNGSGAAVHSIDHFALNVPDLAEARHFFSAFGLEVGEADDSLDIRAGDGHRWARVLPAANKSLAYLRFNCYEGDLPAIGNMARDAGASFEVRGADAVPDGIWFNDPDGNLIHVCVGPKTSPDRKTPLHRTDSTAGERGAAFRSQTGIVRPRRMSHVLLFTPDVLRTTTFYEKALGLCLSDRSGDIIAFTHATYGSDHHLVAFAKSSGKGWHHVAWDVASVDDVGNGARQMAAAGYTKGWGTGRHVLGSNYFHYVQDPWGSFCEYSAGIDYVSAGESWSAGDFPPEDSLYLWGPDVPDYFIRNTEV